jgi:hypothetical protein
MSIVNRITRAITILVFVAVIAAIIAALWAVYYYFPRLRVDIRAQTTAAVRKWFPISDDGSFSFDTNVNYQSRLCSLDNLLVDKGSGRVLDAISFISYDLEAESIELDLNALLKQQPLTVIDLHGVKLAGDISHEDFSGYFTPDTAGIDNIEMEYDDFTEKTIISADIVELMGADVTILGRWYITEDGSLGLKDRSYRNPDGPVGREVIEFIEEHTDITMRFEIFDFPLELKAFDYEGAALSVELERE